jgi:antitoxin YefM
MKTISVTQARQDLYNLLDDTIQNSEPIQIKGKRGSAVLISLSDWNSLEETYYLKSIPLVEEEILEGMKTPIEDCVEDIGWDIK